MSRVRNLLSVAAAVAIVVACGGPKYPNCENDDDCNTDGHSGVCMNGKCVACRDDAGCGHGKECRAGACAPIEGFCDQKTACPGGAPCQNGRCQPRVASRPPPRECGDDLPCPSGQRCENGHCVLPPQGGPGCTEFPAPKFDFEDATIAGSAQEVLRRLADCLTKGTLKSQSVLLTGHCDPRGEDEFNMTLGAQRAEAVRSFLTALGVPANRIALSSRGELDARGVDEAGWSADRRVDIEVR
jgi:peptidoglycan-associated lipoprotein